jgi:TonB-dependent SusC/RagA subfamily outer membrane receptor
MLKGRRPMRRSLLYVFLATTLSGALLSACAPRNTTTPARAEAERNVITAADIEQFPDMPLELVIQRKIPGVTAHNINGVLVLQIRGSMSVKTETIRPPLYVVNGMRTPGGTSGEMPAISPKDVATIKVLKGNDAGIYGMDGANGVIEITTKR